jgi:hypothetical protein
LNPDLFTTIRHKSLSQTSLVVEEYIRVAISKLRIRAPNAWYMQACRRPHRRNGFRTSEDWKFFKEEFTSLLWFTRIQRPAYLFTVWHWCRKTR